MSSASGERARVIARDPARLPADVRERVEIVRGSSWSRRSPASNSNASALTFLSVVMVAITTHYHVVSTRLCGTQNDAYQRLALKQNEIIPACVCVRQVLYVQFVTDWIWKRKSPAAFAAGFVFQVL
jgi:hypothetical protein